MTLTECSINVEVNENKTDTGLAYPTALILSVLTSTKALGTILTHSGIFVPLIIWMGVF